MRVLKCVVRTLARSADKRGEIDCEIMRARVCMVRSYSFSASPRRPHYKVIPDRPIDDVHGRQLRSATREADGDARERGAPTECILEMHTAIGARTDAQKREITSRAVALAAASSTAPHGAALFLNVERASLLMRLAVHGRACHRSTHLLQVHALCLRLSGVVRHEDSSDVGESAAGGPRPSRDEPSCSGPATSLRISAAQSVWRKYGWALISRTPSRLQPSRRSRSGVSIAVSRSCAVWSIRPLASGGAI